MIFRPQLLTVASAAIVQKSLPSFGSTFKSAFVNNSRGMATLSEIKLRIKSVNNIQKITKSMKMVSAAKYARADRELRGGLGFVEGTKKFSNNIPADNFGKPKLVIVCSSDRGLCGGIHGGLTKTLRNTINSDPKGKYYIVVIGDKCRVQLQRLFPTSMVLHFTEIGKKPPTFNDACLITQTILGNNIDFETGYILYNKFKSVISYEPTTVSIFSKSMPSLVENFFWTASMYPDDVPDEVLEAYHQFQFAATLYGAMLEGAASEQSSRMSAMENATKNAGEMINKLTLRYNRTRQAVITNELIEIISGAAAV